MKRGEKQKATQIPESELETPSLRDWLGLEFAREMGYRSVHPTKKIPLVNL